MLRLNKILINALVVWGICLAWGSFFHIFIGYKIILAYKYLYYPWTYQTTSLFSVLPILGLLLMSFLFVLTYAVFYEGLPGNRVSRGLVFGFLIWIIFVPGATILGSYSTSLPMLTQIYSTLVSLGEALFGGMILGYFYDLT